MDIAEEGLADRHRYVERGGTSTKGSTRDEKDCALFHRPYCAAAVARSKAVLVPVSGRHTTLIHLHG